MKKLQKKRKISFLLVLKEKIFNYKVVRRFSDKEKL